MLLPLLALLSCAALGAGAGGVPTVASLSPPAQTAWRLLGQPQVQNFHSSAGLRRDLLSLGTLAFTPLNGNFQNSSLTIDGAPAVLAASRWAACEGSRTGAAGAIAVANAVRLPFESRAALQSWTLTPANSDAAAAPHVLAANLDGPFFRACDGAGAGAGACGWGTSFPVDRASFTSTLVSVADQPAMLTVDSLTGTAAASALWWRSGGVGDIALAVVAQNSTFAATGAFAGTAVLQHAFAAGATAAEALAALAALRGDAAFDAAFAAACAKQGGSPREAELIKGLTEPELINAVVAGCRVAVAAGEAPGWPVAAAAAARRAALKL